MAAKFAKELGTVNTETLIKLPLGKAIKRPAFDKFVEKGAMSSEEATFAEALWQRVYGERKPSITKRNARKVAEWAVVTAQRIERMKAFVEADAEGRRAMMEEASKPSYPKIAEETERFAWIKQNNPGNTYDEPLYTPSEEYVAYEIGKRMGMRPGDRTKIEFRVLPNSTFQYYDIIGADGGRIYGIQSTRNLDEAIDQAVMATRIANKDLEVEYPRSAYRVRGVNRKIGETGKWQVTWFTSSNIKDQTFDTKEEAEAWQEKLKGRGVESQLAPHQAYLNEYEKYDIEFTNPVTREYFKIGKQFDTKEEAMAWLDENHVQASEFVNSIYEKRFGVEKGKKEHYFLRTLYSNGALTYAVCSDENVGNSLSNWPIIKEFKTRDEANAWFKEHHEELEAEYERRKKEKREFVFFEQSEKMRSADDVAKFLSSHRLGDRSKVSVLVCNNQNQIVANVHTTHVSVDSKGLADDIVRAIGEFGGMNAFLYGDFPHSNGSGYTRLGSAVKERSGGVFNLLDVVRIEGNNTWSARNEGYLYEPGSEYGASADGDIRFREVEDDAVLSEFAEGKTVKAYRTMQVIDGKLYSPMATKVGGKSTPEIKLGVPEQAEEHPEIIKRTKIGKDGVGVGYVVIDKGLGKGTLEVAYNPSIHASRTALNDQFTSAHIRPNLVTVEVEIPLSELTSGYRAHMAKDAVGEMSWHSGTVSGQLAKLGRPRRVILSRYDRPVRIVPFREVAAMIADQLDGTDISIPYNMVQPQVRAELERLGVAMSEEATGSVGKEADYGEAEYVTDQEIERINARQQEMAQTSDEAKGNHAVRMSKRLKTPIRIVNDPRELKSSNAGQQERMRRSKGFYDPSTGEVVVVVANNATVEDMAETVLHEVVAHRGLREMVGEENYDAFCDEVYGHLKDELKKGVDEETTRRFVNEPGKGYEHHRRVAVDEMLGRMAEKGFEDFTKAERGIWAKLKTKVLEAINKFLGSLKLPKWVKLGDNELRYMLWRSHERLRTKGDYVDMARDAAKREELGLRANDMTDREDGPDVRYSDKKEKADDNEARLNDLHPADANHGAKVVKILETAKSALTEIARLHKTSTDPRGFITSLKKGLGMLGGASSSGYRSFELKDGRTLTLRVSNHNSNAENARNEPVVSIVIKSRARRNTFIAADNKRVDEYVYMKEEIRKAPAGTLSKIAEGIRELLDTGRYRDRTGLARENHSPSSGETMRFRDGETDDIWKDQSLGLEERITNAAIRLSNNQSGDLTLIGCVL